MAYNIDVDLLLKKFHSFSYYWLAMVQLGEIPLREAVWLIDANADGMFEVLEGVKMYGALEQLEACRADLREGIKQLYDLKQKGDLFSRPRDRSQEVEQAVCQLQERFHGIVSLNHRRNKCAVKKALS